MLSPRSDLVDRLAAKDYDASSRHVIAARMVAALARPGSRVLDVGGSAGLTRQLLPDHAVTVADVIPDDVDVVASGTALPFGPDSFDAAVLLDVLEHVDRQLRSDMISEVGRVAPAVVIAGPFDDPDVLKHEAEQRDHFASLYGRPHPWLAEHFKYGLPSLSATVGALEQLGFATEVFPSNPLHQWSALLEAKHSAQRLGLDRELRPLRRHLLDHFLERADATPPGYRHFVVAARDDRALRSIEQAIPRADHDLVATAISEIRTSIAAIVGKAGQDLAELKAHLLNLEKGLADQDAELHHRQRVIDELTAEAEQRQAELSELREAVNASVLARRAVRRSRR